VAAGKHLFPVEGLLISGQIVKRRVWARSRQELLEKHSSLNFLYHRPFTGYEWDAMGESDIDVDDDFIGMVEKEP
jgi:hypothetical protein